MLSELKRNIGLYLKNYHGWRTKRKLLIIESDDWGSIRMPDKVTYNKLLKSGLSVDKSPFTMFDTLASRDDLVNLMNVLCKVTDRKGNHPVFSPFANVANPDFAKILNCGYNKYYYEALPDTLASYFCDNVFEIWQKGIENELFVPQYHGREHFNVPQWLRYLRQKNDKVLKGFNNNFVHVNLPNMNPPQLSGFAPAYYFDCQDDLEYLRYSIVDGVNLFEKLFGYLPSSFDPPNGIFHPSLEESLHQKNLKCIVTNRKRLEPDIKGKLHKKSFLFKFGCQNEFNQTYYRRNCKFEPFQLSYTGIESTLKEISAAFFWQKPAIISTHRINYVGGLNREIRDYSLIEFEKLLFSIVNKWPDVEFISSYKFGDLIANSRYN